MFTEEEKIKLHDPLIGFNDKFGILVAALDREAPGEGGLSEENQKKLAMVDTLVEKVADLEMALDAALEDSDEEDEEDPDAASDNEFNNEEEAASVGEIGETETGAADGAGMTETGGDGESESKGGD